MTVKLLNTIGMEAMLLFLPVLQLMDCICYLVSAIGKFIYTYILHIYRYVRKVSTGRQTLKKNCVPDLT